MKVDHKISFTATAVTGGLKLFDDYERVLIISKCIISMLSYFFNSTGPEIVCKYPIQGKKYPQHLDLRNQ